MKSLVHFLLLHLEKEQLLNDPQNTSDENTYPTSSVCLYVLLSQDQLGYMSDSLAGA